MGKRKSGGTHGVRAMDNFKAQSHAKSNARDSDESEDELQMFDGRGGDDSESEQEQGVLNLDIASDSESDDDAQRYDVRGRPVAKKTGGKGKIAQQQESSDEDEDNDEDYVAASSKDASLKQLVGQLAPALKRSVLHKLKQQPSGKKGQAASDDEEEDDDDDDSELHNEDLIDNDEAANEADPLNQMLAKQWGKKRDYWAGDTADLEIGQEFADAEDEEEAAKDLMNQTLSRHTEADYFDDVDESFTHTTQTHAAGKLTKKQQQSAAGGKSALNSHQLEHLALDKAGQQVMSVNLFSL